MTPEDARQYAPATQRNSEPIIEVLLQVLPKSGTILEIASGTGEHAAASNAAFDESLRAQNPEWGVRNLDDVVAVASAQNLTFKQTYQMPANNLSVVFERSDNE